MHVFMGLFLVLVLANPAMGQSGFGEYGGATFISVKDTKTILVDLPEYPALIGEKIAVRINGIATPSLKGKCKKETQLAVQAKKFMTKAFQDAEIVDLTNINRGIYFQIVADVLINDENIVIRLVEKGFAVKSSKKKMAHNWCKKALNTKGK
ncbi:MAG: thermonuclease family protein [Nitrospina sp.]|jgi:micrococcal nuclease|nr:thermonuclease family protein [Nitrospina sp.]MBT5632613.1 thermonuclease family protein [Nitrospina sp.]